MQSGEPDVNQCVECGVCEQLEAEPLETNLQLWNFDVKSRNIKWREIVTPLARRGNAVYLGGLFPYLSSRRQELGIQNKKEVLVCHDMMGNYLEDRLYHSSIKFDDYRFFHWSGVDYFCYFSHKYITIPPCGWINAAHMHGVKVLGTFITEQSNLLEEVLRTKDSIDTTISSLVRLCKHFCFEGWLLNIECRVPKSQMDKLFYFIGQLRDKIRSEVDEGSVFWYDSVINTGDLSWQNEVNERNLKFFKLTDAMLINYTWNDRSLESTTQILNTENESPLKTFFGIDVFGRGQVAKFQSKQTLAKLYKTRFSVGFFAPGWTFETLQQFGYDVKNPNGSDDVNEAFLLRNDKFWWSLWEYLPTRIYIQLPLYSHFCVGSGKYSFKMGLKMSEVGQFFNLSKQSLQPSVPLYKCAERWFEDAFNGGCCLKIVLNNTCFRLFTTNFEIDGTLIFAYVYKLKPENGDLDCILRLKCDPNDGECLVFLGDYSVSRMQRGRCYLSPISSNHLKDLRILLDKMAVDIKIPCVASQGEWSIRYYVLNFDATVFVQDIGVFLRKTADAEDTAYLGAVYLNNIDTIALPEESNAAYLEIRREFSMI